MRLPARASQRFSQRAQLVWFFVKPLQGLLLWIVLVTAAVSCAEGLYVAAFLPLFQALIGAGQPPAQGLPANMFALSQALPWKDPVIASAVLILLIVGVKAVFTFWREALVAHASGRVLYSVKQALMERYGNASYQFFIDSQYGTLMHTCAVAPHKVATLVLRFPQFVAEILNSLIILGLLCVIWPAATAGFFVVVLAYHFLTHRLARQISYMTGQGRRDADAAQFTFSHELFAGARHLKIFGVVKQWLSRFQEANRRYAKLYITDTLWLALPRHVMEFTVVALLVVWVLALQAAAPMMLQAKLPLFGVFTLALLRLIPSVTNIGRSRMEMASVMADTEHVYEALTMPLSAPREGVQAFSGLRSAITFEQVSFAHAGRQSLLTEFSLTLEKGKTTAIVGRSGAGKTTIVNLLLGLLEPTSGRILIDGVPLQEFTRETWLHQIGLVSQEPFIVHGTVAENIVFGRIGFSQEDVIRAARIANAHEFILELPQQYDTVVGERGMKLSGGQQQRLAIARAILHQPAILLLDEATSHLDRVAEQQVQAALQRVLEGRTVLLIAHRLSTVRQADIIMVLDGGRIVETGTHEELCGQRSRYAQLLSAAS